MLNGLEALIEAMGVRAELKEQLNNDKRAKLHGVTRFRRFYPAAVLDRIGVGLMD
jgi:hypothetical protein